MLAWCLLVFKDLNLKKKKNGLDLYASHECSALKPCDLWTSLCHPMPGLMQKGLGRQRDAQPSRNHLTVRIYDTQGPNPEPLFDRLK